MAILTGFPPSNTISTGGWPSPDDDTLYMGNPWEDRKRHRENAKRDIKELSKYFYHRLEEGEEEELLDVAWACSRCFSDRMAVTEVPWFLWVGYHLSVAMNTKFGAFYLKKWPWMNEDKWCLERRKDSEHMDPRVVAMLKSMGWDTINHYRMDVDGKLTTLGETPLPPASPESKRALLEAINEVKAKKAKP